MAPSARDAPAVPTPEPEPRATALDAGLPSPTTRLGPSCPKPASAGASLPGAEERVQKHGPSFEGCSRDGRYAAAELTWVVPPKGAIRLLHSPEPDPHEVCIIERAKRLTFPTRAAHTVLVSARVRVEDGKAAVTVSQAPEGRAVVCNIVTHGAPGAGTDQVVVGLADSFTVCYRQAQRSSAAQTGALSFGLELSSDGTVRSAQVNGEHRSDLVRACASATASVQRYPRPAGPAHVEFEVHHVVSE